MALCDEHWPVLRDALPFGARPKPHACMLPVGHGSGHVCWCGAGRGCVDLDKETKNERFERLERERLANRPDPQWCESCRFRLTSHPTGRCRPCRNNPPSFIEAVERLLRSASATPPG